MKVHETKSGRSRSRVTVKKAHGVLRSSCVSSGVNIRPVDLTSVFNEEKRRRIRGIQRRQEMWLSKFSEVSRKPKVYAVLLEMRKRNQEALVIVIAGEKSIKPKRSYVCTESTSESHSERSEEAAKLTNGGRRRSKMNIRPMRISLNIGRS